MKMWMPRPLRERSMRIADCLCSAMNCSAQGAMRPSSMQSSRSMQPMPLPSTQPIPSPAVEADARRKLVHVEGSLTRAYRPSRWIGTFASFPPRGVRRNRTHRFMHCIACGIRRRRRYARCRHAAEQYRRGRPCLSATGRRVPHEHLNMPPFYRERVTKTRGDQRKRTHRSV